MSTGTEISEALEVMFCMDRASICRELASTTTNADVREQYQYCERGWIKLASAQYRRLLNISLQ